MTQKKRASFGFSSRAGSFRAAGYGILSLVKTEPNARLHLCAAILVVGAGLILDVSAADWRWLILSIGWVWSAEALNTSIEHVCDVVTEDFHPGIKLAKDIAAGAVLISAISAAAIGASVFLPYL